MYIVGLDVFGLKHYLSSGFIQARLCKTQGLFKDFLKTFLLFSRTENLRKILIYKLKSTSEMLEPITKGISLRKLVSNCGAFTWCSICCTK